MTRSFTSLDNMVKEMVLSLHDIIYKPKVLIALAGSGGLVGVNELMRHGGGSSTLLGQHLLYSQEMTYKYLGGKPDKLVSEQAARQLAMAAYMEALSLSPRSDVIGIGNTSALMKPKGERDGRSHQIYMAIQSKNTTRTVSVHLNTTDWMTREKEEEINGMLLLYEIAKELHAPLDWLRDFEMLVLKGIMTTKDAIHREEYKIDEASTTALIIRDLLHYPTCRPVYFNQTESFFPSPNQPLAVLSGSFNPLHEGHLTIADMASSMTKMPAVFELSIVNTDKPPLDYMEISKRLKPFYDKKRIIAVSNKARFLDKSGDFPVGTVFVIGFDTYVRIGDRKYYTPDEQETLVKTLLSNKNRFLVFAREVDGKIQHINDYPNHLIHSFSTMVPPATFYSTISSSGIRNGDTSGHVVIGKNT